MSFSAKVKKELCCYVSEKRDCNIAEIAGIINTCGSISEIPEIIIQTENAIVAKKFFTLVKETFSINPIVSIRKNQKFKKKHVYFVGINEEDSISKVLPATGIEKQGNSFKKCVNPIVIKSEGCKRAYIRSAFVSGASLSDPEKSYHLEFINTDKELALSLKYMIASFGLNPKMIIRKGYYVVYLKEGENIVDLLNIMGAHVSLMNLENVRIVKEMRNSVNRIVNCETANLSKTVDASVKQIEDIKYIMKHKEEDFLTPRLIEVVELRLKYPDATLKEIGSMLNPVVGKSGVNHRLRKINALAENIRGGLL